MSINLAPSVLHYSDTNLFSDLKQKQFLRLGLPFNIREALGVFQMGLPRITSYLRLLACCLFMSVSIVLCDRVIVCLATP